MWPAGLVGTGDPDEAPAVTVLEVVGSAVGVADGAEEGAGDGDGVLPGRGPAGGGLATLRSGMYPRAAPSRCVAAAGARGAAHWVKGARGPPAIATTTAPRQMASAAADTKPIRRMARRRRPDGSAKTGPVCTSGV